MDKEHRSRASNGKITINELTSSNHCLRIRFSLGAPYLWYYTKLTFVNDYLGRLAKSKINEKG